MNVMFFLVLCLRRRGFCFFGFKEIWRLFFFVCFVDFIILNCERNLVRIEDVVEYSFRGVIYI